MSNLAYRTWGLREGPPLVLLHGFLGDASDWEKLAHELEQEFYLIAVDLPGHGGSKDVQLDIENAFSDFSEWLSKTLSQLGMTHYSILGYSLGGRLAMNHAMNHPEAVDKLLVESAHPGLEQDADRHARQESDQAWAEKFRSEPLAEVLQSWYHQPVFADLNCQVRDSLMLHRCKINQSGQALADTLEAFSLSRQPAFWGSLADTSTMIHYFHGDRDLKFQDIALRLQGLVSSADIHKVEHSGHNIHREQPEVMAKVIRQAFFPSSF